MAGPFTLDRVSDTPPPRPLPRTPLSNQTLRLWIEALISELRAVQEHMVVLDRGLERVTDAVALLHDRHPELARDFRWPE